MSTRNKGSSAWHHDTKAVVSMWVIPNGGANYELAYVSKTYFPSMEAAEAYAALHAAVPESATAEPWPADISKLSEVQLRAELLFLQRDLRHFLNTDSPDSWKRETADREFCKARIDSILQALKG